MTIRAAAALATASVLTLLGCGGGFKAVYTDVPYQDGQIDRLESAARASGYKIRERTPSFVSFKAPATNITFSEHRGMLTASCFDSQDPRECDDVVRAVASKAGIPLR